ncbi:MAG: pYEATS domain-containing protein [Hyphomicrobiaceae bacterium]
MTNTLSTFSDAAKGLARNPIGIIALFIVLIYGFASLVTAFSGSFTQGERVPLIYFLVCFPVLVLVTFAWLVSKHHNKLYAPSDFRDETLFVSIVNPPLAGLKTINPLEGPSLETETLPERRLAAIREAPEEIPETPSERSAHREKIYEDTRGFFIVHVIQPSRIRGQKYDIFIYLVGRNEKPLDEIKSAEFFFGRHWGNRIYKGERSGNYIGVRTSAYGPFLCTCKVTFSSGDSAMIYRFIDFEMGNLLSKRTDA